MSTFEGTRSCTPCTEGTSRVLRAGFRCRIRLLGRQFAGHCQAEQVGAAACCVHLVARHHVARAHRAAPVLRQAPTPEHISTAPANPPWFEKSSSVGCGSCGMVFGSDPQVFAGIGSADDLAGVEAVFRVERALDGLKCGVDLGTEEFAVPEAASQAVAVFAAHRTTKLDHQV